jgi:hypothetical protein
MVIYLLDEYSICDGDLCPRDNDVKPWSCSTACYLANAN